jgi:hypothetical protein
MIRCIRLWTGDDNNSYFEEGVIDLSKGERGDILGDTVDVVSRHRQLVASGQLNLRHRQ